MKKSILALATFLLTMGMNAQELPQKSPAATTTQRVGLTDVEVVYSRPAIKGRTIFGDLVPYDALWRTGANKATQVTFSTPVAFGETKVDAGSYSLFTIPGKDKWTVILNKNTELWGTDGYSEEQDAARFVAVPKRSENVESMRITIETVSDEGAELVIAWEGVSVSVPLKVSTHDVAMQNIAEALASEDANWSTYRNAAGYFYDNNIELEKALEYIEKSLELKGDNWYSHFMHAEILAATGNTDDAEEAAEEAIEIGEKAAEENGKSFNYTGMIEAFIEGLED